MANPEHLEMLQQGVEFWNRWREDNPGVQADLSKADLSGANLYKANLSEADLSDANLCEAKLTDANLCGADLRRVHLRDANLMWADLSEADLSETDLDRADLNSANLSRALLSDADLSEANLCGANLSRAVLTRAKLWSADLGEADLSEADLESADLSYANLVETVLTDGANLTGCKIYGVSAWRLELDHTTKQADLIITRQDEPVVTVDNLEVAQFVYLLLHNEKIRDVLKTITSKVVLILGRFTPERKAVLDAMRDELRRRDLLPVLFDFEKPDSRDLTETVSTLAHMARFIIADITDAKSIPQELQAVVPNLPSVAVQPVLSAGDREYAMFEHFKRFPWVLPVYEYEDTPTLLAALPEKVIAPAQAKADELQGKL